MLFLSAGFLFCFLPLFLLMLLIAPRRWKRAALLLGSVAFYVLANLHNPFSILILWATVLFHYFAALLLQRRRDRVLLFLFVAVDVMALLSLRLLCNQMNERFYFTFPIGASLYLLMGISYLVDHYRDPSLHAEDLTQTALYLTFFPVILAGPLICFRDFLDATKHLSFRMDHFARGARWLTIGLVKGMVAAVLTEAYDSILQSGNLQVNIGIGSLSLIMMYLIVFFAFSGYSDMGVGICVMIGMPIYRDYKNPLAATSPIGYLRGFFISFFRFWETYVLEPLSGLSWGSQGMRRLLGMNLYVIVLTLWFRTDVDAILIALPLLLVLNLEQIPAVGQFLGRRVGKVVGWLITLPVMIVYWSMQKLGSYAQLGEYLKNLSEVSGSYQSMYTYAASIGFDFVIVAVVALVILLPLSHRGITPGDELVLKRGQALLDAVTAMLLIALLVLSLVYFMPQFPQYAVSPYAYFVI